MTTLHPAAARSLATWHAMVSKKDLSAVGELLAADAVFRSPVVHAPYASAPVVSVILNAALAVLEDFTYHRELATADGLSVVLEFSARVGTRQLKGIDFVRFDEHGKIVEFEVMVRPMSGLVALGEQMSKRLAPYLAAQKGIDA